MKNIEKGSVKHLIISIVIYIVMGLILYPIFDILYCKLITNTEFVYSFEEDVIKPVVIGSVMGLCSWFMEKK